MCCHDFKPLTRPPATRAHGKAPLGNVDEVKALYTELHETIKEDCDKINYQAMKMAAQISSEASKPTAAGNKKKGQIHVQKVSRRISSEIW